MSPALVQYLQEVQRMLSARLRGDETEEDRLLDQLDDLWWALAERDRDAINALGQQWKTLSDTEVVALIPTLLPT